MEEIVVWALLISFGFDCMIVAIAMSNHERPSQSLRVFEDLVLICKDFVAAVTTVNSSKRREKINRLKEKLNSAYE